VRCIDVSQTSSVSEVVSVRDQHLGFYQSGRSLSCQTDIAPSNRKPGQTSSESEEVFDPVLIDRRKIPIDPIEGLALRKHRRHAATMIHLKPLPDDLTILDQSHVFRGARLILGYVAEHGAIPLTPSKPFAFENHGLFVWLTIKLAGDSATYPIGNRATFQDLIGQPRRNTSWDWVEMCLKCT
jgi:hypothetical protein